MKHQTLNYRGIIQGIASMGHYAAFITHHAENQATALYRLDASQEKVLLSAEKLSCGASALVSNGKTIWFVGENGAVYQSGLVKGKVKALPKLNFTEKVIDLALLTNNYLAVLQLNELSVVDLTNHQIIQNFQYDEINSKVASSPDGLWFAVANSKGLIRVYRFDDKTQEYLFSAEAMIHEGPITALQFEANELRFYSAGKDKKLYRTHAQGKLEALDRGKSSNHNNTIHSILLGSERFFTGSHDKSIKAWPVAGGQPVTLNKNLGKVYALETLLYQEKKCLLVAETNSSLRIVGLTSDEKLTEVLVQIKDGYAKAKQQLQHRNPSEREKGIVQLANYDDKTSLMLLTKHFEQEKDNAICEKIVTLIGASKHPASNVILESFLADKRHDTVRKLAFNSLLKRTKTGAKPLSKTLGDLLKQTESGRQVDHLRPFQKALETTHVDIGSLALQGLKKLAKKEPRANQMLLNALQHQQATIRLLALDLLEGVYKKTSPKASLEALKTHYPDLQGAALIRLYQRKLLNNIDVKRAILLAQDQEDDQLRHTSFLVAILSQPKLAKALKTREENFARQLQELEDFQLLSQQDDNTTKETKKNIKKAAKPSPISKLGEDDYAVLIQGMSNRYNNVCFNASFALAILKDQRAFGSLLLLSQEKNSTFRIGVCYAFAQLDQVDAVPSLEIMLDDSDSNVRDAAFTALEQIQKNALLTAERGLASKHQDIHARALSVFLATEAKQLKKSEQIAFLQILKNALNDPFDEIRQETFKRCLNRNLGGNKANTLRLLLESLYENIHQEVLNELMVESGKRPIADWVEPILLKLFDTQFLNIRRDAFKFAIQEKKVFSKQKVLEAAVHSQFVDMRRSVLEQVSKHSGISYQTHLETLLNDHDETIRESSIANIIIIGDKKMLLEALKSPYDDIQALSANALAKLGETESYDTLMRLLKKEKPRKKQHQEYWLQVTSNALKGLAYLQDKRAFAAVVDIIKGKEKQLLTPAIQALPWVSHTSHTNQLLELQQEGCETIRAWATFSLALLGDEAAKTLFKNDKLINKHIKKYNQLAASISLEEVTPLTLQYYLNNHSTKISALLVLVSSELLKNHQSPDLSMWALSLPNPELQQFCAGLISQYSNSKNRWAYLQNWLIQYHDDEKWTISIKTLQEIAAVLTYADGHTKARLLSVMQLLDASTLMKQWHLHYQAFKHRYTDHIEQAIQQVDSPASIKINKTLQSSWNQRTFGTYIGLVRQNNIADSHAKVITLRLKALRGMHQLAQQDDGIKSSVMSCLLTLLNHHQYEIRQFAFDDLKNLGMDFAILGKTATTSPQQDIAKQGLQLLIEHYPVKESHTLLQSLIQGNDEILSVEAYTLYQNDQGLANAAVYAVTSDNLPLRRQCVNELAVRTDDNKIIKLLLKAGSNSDVNTAILANTHLAKQQHEKAFKQLQILLNHNQDKAQQQQIIRALKQLPETKVAEYLFSYLENNPLKRIDVDDLYSVIADYRPEKLFDPLLQRLSQQRKEAKGIMQCLMMITGYDQAIEDFNEESDDRSWLDKQHPRKDNRLVQFFDAMLKLDYQTMAVTLLKAMAWTKAKKANQSLLDALPLLEEQYLPDLIKAMNYRLKRRNSKPEGLLKLLTHKNLDIQFLAAEGLAVNGHSQGYAILLAASDYQENDEYRQRAILAIGRLGHQSALDKLLKLAQDKEHALNEVAIEAIGAMGDSEHAEKIFKLLKSSLHHADYYSDMKKHALNGLRWFNTLASWQQICAFIEDKQHLWSDRQHATKLLQYWDTKASRDVLLRLLKTEADDDVTKSAYHVAQRLWKTPQDQTSVVDFALIQGHYPELDEKALERISQYASSAELLSLLTIELKSEDSAEMIRETIDQSLLKRTDIGEVALSEALQSHSPRIIDTIARLLMRIDTLSKPVEDHFKTALNHYYQLWNQQFVANRVPPNELSKIRKTFKQLLWTAIKHGVITDSINTLLLHPKKEQKDFQRQILNALLSLETLPNKALLEPLQQLLHSPSLEVKNIANQLMAKHDENALLDWRYFHGASLMDEKFSQPLLDAVEQVSHQAQALPVLIAKKDVKTLLNIAQNEQQQETVRIGAIEGLARIPTSSATDALVNLHKNNTDEDMSKIAYRALRRQQRNQKKMLQLASNGGI